MSRRFRILNEAILIERERARCDWFIMDYYRKRGLSKQTVYQQLKLRQRYLTITQLLFHLTKTIEQEHS